VALKVLIAEDEQDVADIVAFAARMSWPDCEVLVAPDGETALREFEQARPDLVVLDIGIPAPDGFEVCRRIREVLQVPIIMLTARNDTVDKVRALELGADDYVTKPFDHLELLARLRALVRRAAVGAMVPAGEPILAPASASSHVATLGDLRIDFAAREVQLEGEVVPLTSTEYRLLEELVRSAGEVVPHRQLLERVWGPEYVGEDHYIKVFVRRLRIKLHDNSERPRYIQTEWGIGYRFAPN
jgi:two-component system, OmpR family, KDP operon response regulator KdpE